MKLKRLILKNFKGVKEFDLILEGQNAEILGKNGTGKTTIYDALCWLLFDKDSKNQKQFEIKTLDNDNEAIHGLDHEVEGVFSSDVPGGVDLVLKKSFKEKWTKTRGQSQKVFSGHTTEYWIDGVPIKLKEWKKRTEHFFNEETFKMITNPLYFPEILPWKARRDLLLEICGNVSNADVIQHDPDLSTLENINIDDHKKVIEASRKKLNDEINKIPVRIDEVSKSIVDLKDVDVKLLQNALTSTKAAIIEKEKEIARIINDEEKIKKENEFQKVHGKYLKLKNTLDEAHQKKVRQHNIEINRLQEIHMQNENELRKNQNQIKEITIDIDSLKQKIEAKRQEWHTINGMKFNAPEQSDICPACGQNIPEATIQEVHEKALQKFNLTKSKDLEKIQMEGKSLNNDFEKKQKEFQQKVQEVEALMASVAASKSAYDFEKNKEIPNETSTNKDLIDLQNKCAEIKESIKLLDLDKQPMIDEIKSKIQQLESDKQEIESKISGYNNSLNAKARIKELSDEERNLAASLEKIESELFLIEKFTKSKVELLESKINSMFEIARFKLFNVQINGALDDCCEVLYNGVPFNSSLNTGARINVGLDIIRTLQKHYDTQAPVFIDNAESLTSFIDMDCQIVKLIADKSCDKLIINTK